MHTTNLRDRRVAEAGARRRRFLKATLGAAVAPWLTPLVRGMGGSTYVTDKACPERARASRTILGTDQERWLDQSFESSRARWNIIVQQTLMSTLSEASPDGSVYWTDAWDGYPAARERVASSLLRHRVSNPLIVGGDYHCTIAADFKQDFARPESRTIAIEFVGTSISSPGMPAGILRKKMDASPHIRYGNSERRGYLLFDVKDDVVDVAMRTLDSVSTRDGACVIERRFAVAEGRPGYNGGVVRHGDENCP
jgi:alkaline phosphatase D